MNVKLKEENEFSGNFKAFVRDLASEATIMDRMYAARNYKPSAIEKDEAGSNGEADSGHRTQRAAGHRGHRKNKGIRKTNNESGKPTVEKDETEKEYRGKRGRAPPRCFNAKCGEYHFVHDCPITTEAEKEKFLEEYPGRKKARAVLGKKGGGSVRSVSLPKFDSEHTSMFSSFFCSGSV